MISYELIQKNFIYVVCGGILFYIIKILLERYKKAEVFCKVMTVIAFLIYMLGLFYITLLGRTKGNEYDYELTLFWSYRAAFNDTTNSMWMEIIGNVCAFLPLGIFIKDWKPKMHWYTAMIMGCFLSLGIELTQLFCKLGLFEFDDIIHNTAGTLIGFLFARMIQKFGGKGKA